jgi:ribonuclease R
MDKEKILKFMEEKTYHPVKLRELAKSMRIPDENYGMFRRTIREMLRSGAIVKIKKNRLGLPDKLSLVVGKFVANPKGFGFVIPEDKSPDVYLSPDNVGTALHGDKVIVRLSGKKTGESREGSIIKILERSHKFIVGTFKKSKHFAFVQPDDTRISKDIYVSEDNVLNAKIGQKVLISLDDWTDEHLNPEGKITEVLGFPDEPGMDILTIIKEYELPLAFPSKVLAEVEELPIEIPEEEFEKRLDLRKKNCFTIDPIDAKDHDDAVSLEILPNGNYLLGVHIADVSFYVKENSALDLEALQRGTSVYLVDRVIPMLPEKLSNNVCSLKPDEDKLTYSCILEINPEGKVIKSELKETIIRSKAKLNYEEVQNFFDTKKGSAKFKKLGDELIEMLKLSQILLKRRKEVGSLDFDLPEANVLLGKAGEVLDIFEVIRLESHRLIEEFMLLANQTVAKKVSLQGNPFLYRVHEQPDKEKLEAFSNLMENLGYSFKIGPKITPKKIQRFLDSVQKKPEEPVINELLLRSLKRACYQTENIGHFGLAFEYYTHFTSPIRRYPDLIVHRLLKELKSGRFSPARHHQLLSKLPKIGEIASEREKIADEAERKTIKIKQVEFLQNKLGEVFWGVISGILPFGFFVRLEKLMAEGMVRLSSIEDDYYVFDEKKYRLVGRHNQRVFQIGDRVKVQISKVDKEKKEIDFYLLGGPSVTAKKRK